LTIANLESALKVSIELICDTNSGKDWPLSVIDKFASSYSDASPCTGKTKINKFQSLRKTFSLKKFILLAIIISIILIFTLPPLIDDSLSTYTEFKLLITPLTSAESQCLSKSHQSDIIVTLTTLPKRLDKIDRTIKTLLLGTFCPAKIYVWIPTFNRRLNQSYSLPEWLIQFNKTSTIVKIFPIEIDYGPGTKLIAPLINRQELNLNENQRLLIIDDDVLYSKQLIQTHDCYTSTLPMIATGINGCILKSLSSGYEPFCYRGEKISSPKLVQVLFGTASFLIRPKYFNLTQIDNFLLSSPADAHYEDDWYFSTLMSHLNIEKYILPIDRRQLVQIDTLWTKRGALIDTDNNENLHWNGMIDYYRETGAEKKDEKLFFKNFEEEKNQQSKFSSETIQACLALR